MDIPIKISQYEYQTRTSKLLEYIQLNNLSGIVLFDNYYILYYTGFAFIPTERPIAFVMNSNGECVLFVPRLEKEHASANAYVDRVDHYIEYPFDPHPMEILEGSLESLNIRGKCGVDTDGYPWILGYRGPTLSELLGNQVPRIAEFIEDQMMIKSPAELALIRESIKWSNLAHSLLQTYTRIGATETEVSQRASREANQAMLEVIGSVYRAQSPFSNGVEAGYRGQIGRNAAIPHSLANNIVFQDGDVLVSGAGAPMWGYHSELERTLLIGSATDRQKRFFDHMLALQDTALTALKPGENCAEVDRVVRNYYEKNELMPYWKHHSGHAIGLRYHEGPFLDIGDDTIIKPGMVFTVEPGLYAPDLGGFRHSDTVLITDMGIEIMTYYPAINQSYHNSLMMISERFVKALLYAAHLHANQTRKGGDVPYIAHLLGVSALVLENGGDENQAIAGLLHDAVEDQGGMKTLDEIRSLFGDQVAVIVEGCTDAFTIPKPPWRKRKEDYLAHLARSTSEIRLVSLADKLHNARSLLRALRIDGESVWVQFNGGKEGTLWYYRTILDVFKKGGSDYMTDELERVIKQILGLEGLN